MLKNPNLVLGFFFGFKLHIIINDKDGLMVFKITRGNVDDCEPVFSLVKGSVAN